MEKRGFSLMEVIVVVIIVGVLATLGFPAYQNSIDYSNSKVCKANLEALQTALDIYAMEHDRIPGDLSQLPAEYINKGLAKVRREGGWKLKLAYWLVEVRDSGLAYAELMQRLQGGVVMTCPASRGAHSYGLWSGLANLTALEYRQLSDTQPLVADCAADTFDALAGTDRRHAIYRILSADSPYSWSISRTSLIQSGPNMNIVIPRIASIIPEAGRSSGQGATGKVATQE
jgi:prepilin-type N-terminal cleavage/methylation domain-containing protein